MSRRIIGINSDEELMAFGVVFRTAVSGNPVPAEAHYYAPSRDEHNRAVQYMASRPKETQNEVVCLRQYGGVFVSLSLTLDVDEAKSEMFFHLSAVGLKMEDRAYFVIPEEVARAVANNVAGTGWTEVPHPGTMIPQIRHFLAPVGTHNGIVRDSGSHG